MPKLKISSIFFFLIGLFLLNGCSKRIHKIVYPTLSDGRYDSEFPYKSSSSELKEITESVRRVFCSVQYKNYVFPATSRVTVANVDLDKAETEVFFRQSVSGTGTIIFYDGTKAAVLSCAHVFDKPDTIITYFNDEHQLISPFIQSIAIKEEQQNLVFGFPEDGDCEILISDRETDTAVLVKEFIKPPKMKIPTLNYQFGKARQLEWGSFVYLVGYPRGYQIVTKGIVSNPDRDKKGSFLIDALFNPGMSGGILLAIRDGVPNFEIVGITTSAAAEYATVLVPEKSLSNYDESIPYDGRIFVDNKKSINYGITRAISSESILELFKKNKKKLEDRGYNFDFL